MARAANRVVGITLAVAGSMLLGLVPHHPGSGDLTPPTGTCDSVMDPSNPSHNTRLATDLRDIAETVARDIRTRSARRGYANGGRQAGQSSAGVQMLRNRVRQAEQASIDAIWAYIRGYEAERTTGSPFSFGSDQSFGQGTAATYSPILFRHDAVRLTVTGTDKFGEESAVLLCRAHWTAPSTHFEVAVIHVGPGQTKSIEIPKVFGSFFWLDLVDVPPDPRARDGASFDFELEGIGSRMF